MNSINVCRNYHLMSLLKCHFSCIALLLRNSWNVLNTIITFSLAYELLPLRGVQDVVSFFDVISRRVLSWY